VRVARYLENRVRTERELERLPSAQLTCLFRRRGEQPIVEQRHRHVAARVRLGAPSITRLRVTAIRAAIFNHRTVQDDIDRMLEAVLAFPIEHRAS